MDNDLFYIKSEPITNNSFANFFDRKGSVIEIKYDLESENKINEITRQFNFRLTKNSKYVTGILNLY